MTLLELVPKVFVFHAAYIDHVLREQPICSSFLTLAVHVITVCLAYNVWAYNNSLVPVSSHVYSLAARASARMYKICAYVLVCIRAKVANVPGATSNTVVQMKIIFWLLVQSRVQVCVLAWPCLRIVVARVASRNQNPRQFETNVVSWALPLPQDRPNEFVFLLVYCLLLGWPKAPFSCI